MKARVIELSPKLYYAQILINSKWLNITDHGEIFSWCDNVDSDNFSNIVETYKVTFKKTRIAPRWKFWAEQFKYERVDNV